MVTPSRPWAAEARTRSMGNSPDASICAARGASTSRANRSTDALKERWSGVRSRIMWLSSVVLREAFEDRPQSRGRPGQLLGQNARVAHDGNEARVAGPAR